MDGSKRRIENWKSLIDDLKRYGEIKLVIKEEQVKRDMIKKEIDDLDTQKRAISKQCQNGISFLNEINNKMFYFKGLIEHYNKDIDNKIKTSSRFSVPSPIFIIYNNIGKEEDNWEEKNNTEIV
jgi:hypothetical protein